MTTLTLVDSEATVRDWARTEAHITAVVGTRVFFSTPLAYRAVIANTNAPPVNSYIVLTLISETHQVGDLGLQIAVIQVDAWGKSKALAATAVTAFQTAVRQLSYGKPVSVGQSVISWADVNQKRWQPDPTRNIPRYILDVQFALHGAEA